MLFLWIRIKVSTYACVYLTGIRSKIQRLRSVTHCLNCAHVHVAATLHIHAINKQHPTIDTRIVKVVIPSLIRAPGKHCELVCRVTVEIEIVDIVS